MLNIRLHRADELPAILARSTETALTQVSTRESPGASREAVGTQVQHMYAMALAMPGGAVLVVDWPHGVAGDRGPAAYALLMPQPNAFTGERELVVLDIYVNPHLRGHRVARLLLDRAAGYARSIGCGMLVAQVALHNRSSLRLFEGAGFAGERVVLGRRL